MTDSKEVKKSIRFTHAEIVEINKQCKKYNMKFSEYIRLLVNDSKNRLPLQTPEDRKLKKTVIYEINKIGNNINQIVHNHNSGIYSDYEKQKLFALLREIQKKL